MKEHIETVIKKYDYVVDNWEVANEMISDLPGEFYRTEKEDMKWRAVFSDPFEFILWVFQCAQNVLLKINSPADVYYNDYSLPLKEKREKVLELIRILRGNGIRIDGIGVQSHWTLDWPDLNLFQNALNDFYMENLKVRINEFEVSIYTRDDWTNKIWEPEKEFTKATETIQARRFKDAFELFKKNKIESVTLWGVNDEESWLNRFPTIRKNYPLLFSQGKQKKAFEEIMGA